MAKRNSSTSAQSASASGVPTRAGERYLDRDLSWIDFNERVLDLAEHPGLPLLERIKFAAIYASNLDEYFVVRVAGMERALREQRASRGIAQLSPDEMLRRVRARVLGQEGRLQELLRDELFPALADEGVHIKNVDELTPQEREEASEIFWHEVLPGLTPMPLRKEWSFPGIPSLAIGLAVRMRTRKKGKRRWAYVRQPRSARMRFVTLGDEGRTLVPLEKVLLAHVGDIFPDYIVDEATLFRIYRDADVIYGDLQDNVVEVVEQELRYRRHGPVVRVKTLGSPPEKTRQRLNSLFGTNRRHSYEVSELLGVDGLWQVYGMPGLDHLREHFPPAVTSKRLRPPKRPVQVTDGSDDNATTPAPAVPAGPVDIFAAIRERDILVHHPYESYDTSVEHFVQQAVEDDDVLALKHTIYRTSDDTGVVPALIHTRNSQRRAVCLVEIKARFDELNNMHWGRELKAAGVEVSYGLPGLKTHSKAILVVRNEAGGVRRYAHLGTGNYHGGNARIYEDFGLMTDDPDICADIADLFHFVTDNGLTPTPRKMLIAPFNLRTGIAERIQGCATAAKGGAAATITMKMNGLIDRKIIDLLYEASNAGVTVNLNVRGPCALRPGVPGLSDNIRVISIVGRRLEHSRIYHFNDGDNEEVFIGSADMMPRNLNRRIETLTPVEDPKCKTAVLTVLARYMAEEQRAWELDGHGTWRPLRSDERSIDDGDVQLELAERYRAGATDDPIIIGSN